MKVKASVLEAFGEPLVMLDFETSKIAPGEVLAKVDAAGVCGSDVHIWKGNDPRTPVPIILGHEGVGRIAELGAKTLDVFGRELKEGDRVVVADDLIATGGTARAAAQLVEKCGAQLHEVATVIELSALNGRQRIAPYPLHTLLPY